MSTSISFLSGNKLETITFDSVQNVRPSFRNDVSKHPVEKGSTATDNSRKEPDQLSLEGALVTDFPVTIKGGGVGGDGEKGKAGGVLDLLLYLKTKGVKLTVRTTLKTYSNMVIESITPNSDRIKGAVRMSIALSEVQVVESETVDVQVAANRVGQKKGNKGEQPLTPATDKEKGKSVAAAGYDALAEKAKALLKAVNQ